MATVLRGGQGDTQSEQQRRRGGELTGYCLVHIQSPLHSIRRSRWRLVYAEKETAPAAALFFAALTVTLLAYRNPARRILTGEASLLRSIVSERNPRQ
jgi:hypothetical protein